MKEFVISEAKAETAILVGLITGQQDEAKTNEYLDELEFLATTAGARTVKRFTQKVGGPSSVTYCCLVAKSCLTLFDLMEASLFLGFSRPEYWSGLLFLSPGDPLDSWIKSPSLESPALQVDSLPLSHKWTKT